MGELQKFLNKTIHQFFTTNTVDTKRIYTMQRFYLLHHAYNDVLINNSLTKFRPFPMFL